MLKHKLIAVFFVFVSSCCWAQLTDNIKINSQVLGYSLQYRVFIPQVNATEKLPVIFLVDGQWYLSKIDTVRILNELISRGEIAPVIAVFLDSRNPEDLRENRREQHFKCRYKFVRFFIDELLPTIERNFPISNSREQRVIGGLSYGALNAACFGLMANKSFGGLAMQSPAHKRHLEIIMPIYLKTDLLPLKIFHSVGTKDDNTDVNREFHKILQHKFSNVAYFEVPYRHNWENWRSLTDDMLIFFFKSTVK